MLAALVTPTLILGLSLSVGSSNHLLFHVLVELFSLVVALTALVVASTSRRFTHNHFTVFVAVVTGWCAVLDALHTLSFPGMGVFPVHDGGLTTQFWLAARLLQAFALLFSPVFLRRSIAVNPLHAIFAMLVSGLVLWIMSGSFPPTYVEGRGLTAFKVNAEYLIIVMLLVTALLLWRQRRSMAPRLFVAMQAVLVLMALSEFAFTRYASDHDLSVVVGHVFKAYAYWFIYLALVRSTLREPFDMLSRTAGTYDAIPDPVCLIRADGTILQANRAAGRQCSVLPQDLVGRSVHEAFHAPGQGRQDCPVCTAMARGVASFRGELEVGAGRVQECSVAPFGAPEGRSRYVHVAYDVTERKRLADEREKLVQALGERVKELHCLHAVSDLLNQAGRDLPVILSEVLRLLPPAFLYPQHARAAMMGETGFLGERGAEQARHRITQDLIVDGRRFGALHVFYDGALESAAPGSDLFLPEERALLFTVAQRVGQAIERLEAAAKVERLTYLYDMLSATNRAIVRCGSKDELLQRVFETLIRHGTFPVLFIATARDGGASWQLVHSHGIDVSRRQELEALLADVHGPQGQLRDELRQGKVICARLPAEGGQGTWLEYLRVEGVEESALLPLLCNGHVFGVISLYASGVGTCDPAQLRLLNELVADLQFALNGLTAIERSEAAEQRAAISETRFREVFELSPLPMMIESVSSLQVKTVNRAFQQWLGYALDDIPTEDVWFEQMHADPEVRQRLRSGWQKALERARTSTAVLHSPELHLRAKNGEERIAQGKMTMEGDDIIIAWTDLTDIRRAEAALRASEAHFRNMIEQTVTSIYVRRGERFVYVNPSFCQLIGWSPEELLAGRYWDFVAADADNVQHVREAWGRLERGERNARSEVRFVCKSGELRELGLHGTTIPWDKEAAVIVMAADITQRKQAERQIADYVKQLEASMRGTLQAVANMIDLRDPYTAGHERRVGMIAGAIARELGWAQERCSALELIGLVHDIGKIAVPAEILSKPGRLLPVEMEMVRGHAQAGYEILKDVPFSFPVAEVIYQHHERLDGSGYPRGLKDGQILPEARILAVADVLESMAAHRPYRPALGVEMAVAELEKGRAVIYDADVVDAVRRLIHDKGYTLPV